MSDALIAFNTVSVHFGAQRVLRNVELQVPHAQTLVLIGESGCGKTVALKLIVGLLRASTGEVLFDGKRLALMAGKAEVDKAPKETAKALAPPKAMTLLSRILADPDELVEVALGVNDAMFRTAKVVVYTRLVEGRFPPWQSVLPGDPPIKVPVTIDKFFSAVRQARIVTSTESKAVKFTFEDGSVILRGQGADVLIEGMAHYSTLLFLEAEHGRAARIDFARHLEANYNENRRVDGERPLLQVSLGRPHDETVVYDKGAWALFMLHHHLGREQMSAGLHDFIGRFAGETDHPLLEDLFETLRPRAASPHPRACRR